MAETPAQVAILIDLLVSGDDKAENISRRTGFHRNTLSGNMGTLVDEGFISAKGGGVYRLTDSGRAYARGVIKSRLEVYESD